VSLVGLCLDDLPPEPGLGDRHGELTAWLAGSLDDGVDLFVVPTHYTGCDRTPYLDSLDRWVPSDVLIGWTGRLVANDVITTAEAEAWSAAMSGRLPLLWDNTPVNDALMASRLRAGPLRGRAPELVPRLGGYLANPMVQAMASIPALLSAAAWLRGEHPVASWRAALGDQWVLAEGCDTDVPLALGRLALAGTREPRRSCGPGSRRPQCANPVLGATRWGRGSSSCSARPQCALPPSMLWSPMASNGLAGQPRRSSCGPVRARSSSRCSAVGVGSPPDAEGVWIADGSAIVAPSSLTDLLVAGLAERL
jgi:hypothetical protein